MKSKINKGLAQLPHEHPGSPAETREPFQFGSEKYSDKLSRNNGSYNTFHFLIETEEAFENGFIRGYN